MLFRRFDRNPTRALLVAAAAVLLGACDKGEPPSLTLTGDSIIPVARIEFSGGQKSAECAFTVKATAKGPEGSSVTIQGGRVVYVFHETGDTMMKRPLDATALADFFGGKNTIEAGKTIEAKRQGMSLSQPVRPIRGAVTFDYTAKDESKTRTTAPYTFICQ